MNRVKKLLTRIVVILSIGSMFFVQTATAVVNENDDPYTDDASIEVTLEGSLNEIGKVDLVWSKYEGDDLKWYKIVHSQTSTQPYYPEDGYIAVIGDVTKTTHTHTDVPGGTNYYSACVITTDNRRGCSNTVTIDKEETPDQSEKFSDIKDHWAKEYIEDLASKEVIEGYEDGKYYPDNEVLRSEAIKMVMQGVGFTLSSCDPSIFPDLNGEDWFCKTATLAFKKGFIEGDDGMLYPARKITRAEAVKILLSAKSIETPNVDEIIFSDVDPSDWYAGYVYKAHVLEYVEGVDGKFEPNRGITRAELAKIVSVATK